MPSPLYPGNNYKPFPIRTPFLVGFILLILLLIALIETAFHTLPKAVGPGLISTTLNTTHLLSRSFPIPGSGKSPCECGNPPKSCYAYGMPLYPSEEAVESDGSQTPSEPPTPTILYPSRNSSSLATPLPPIMPRADNKIPHHLPAPPRSVETRLYQYWTIPKGLYFLGSYFPVLTAVVLSALWSIVDTSVKGMEPFYQLASPTGATGARSLTMKARTSGLGRTMCCAIAHRHWAVFLSSAIGLLVTLIVPLSSEMIFINTKSSCIHVSSRVTHCFGKPQLSKVIARITEGLLACTGILAASLTGVMWCRRSGVYADPSSIAGLATLLQNDDMLAELRYLDPWISDDDLSKVLANRRFRIGHFRNPNGIDGYGFTSYNVGLGVRNNQEPYRGESKTSSAVSRSEDGKAASFAPQKPMAHRSLWLHPTLAAAFALALIGVLTLVTCYHIRGGDTGFERFMDSQGFGVSFLMTGMGVMVKTYWSSIEGEIRSLEPYRTLSLRRSPARDTILVTSKSTPVTALPSAVISLHPFLALIAFNTILAEILTVTLSSVPWKGESIYIAISLSAILTISIIAFMLATLAWVAVRGTQILALPRRPDTIASVLVYLCGGETVRNFQGLAMVKGEVRDEVVAKMEKTYWLGKVVGVDGVERVGLGVDNEIIG